jgi:hypothetical protein
VNAEKNVEAGARVVNLKFGCRQAAADLTKVKTAA